MGYWLMPTYYSGLNGPLVRCTLWRRLKRKIRSLFCIR